MNAKKVIKELREKYPGKNIIPNDPKHPTEIICEVEPSSEHPEYSRAVFVIDESTPHHHKKTTEKYKVIKGKLMLNIDGVEHELSKGDSFVIKPGFIHFAKGIETWAECYSTPGWLLKDHVLDK